MNGCNRLPGPDRNPHRSPVTADGLYPLLFLWTSHSTLRHSSLSTTETEVNAYIGKIVHNSETTTFGVLIT